MNDKAPAPPEPSASENVLKERDTLRAKVTGMKYILIGMIILEASRLLESLVGATASLAGPIFCAVLVVYGVFMFYNYGMR